MQPDSIEYSSLNRQWSHWKALHFWASFTLGSVVWAVLSGNAYVLALTVFSALYAGFEVYSLYREQKFLREHKESVAKTQEILSKTTIG